MKLTNKKEKFDWFITGFLVATFIFSFIITEFFTAKRYLKQKVFYMDGALYRLEKVR